MNSETPQQAQTEAPAKQAPSKVARLRLDRAGNPEAAAAPAADTRSAWNALRALLPDALTMRRHKLFAETSDDDITRRFDLLRTLLTDPIEEHGILRLGVTAPTDGAGTSFVAANLALAMARRPGSKVLLVDMNLRRPGLARMFGATPPAPIVDVLNGKRSAGTHLRLFGDNLALMLNAQNVEASAELLQDPASADALQQMRRQYGPTLEIYDLPPVLDRDDLLSFLPQLDGVLLVADGLSNTASQVRAAEELMKGRTRLVAVVLNRGEIRTSLYDMVQALRRRLPGRREKDNR